MRNAFLYPLTSRAREIFYKSPPAPIRSEVIVLVGVIECSSRLGTGLITEDNDTVEKAILEVFPDLESGWGPYQAPGDGGCCTARIADWGDGFLFFDFRQVRFKITVEGQTPGSTHTLAVEVKRREDGTLSEWSSLDTLSISATANEEGILEFLGTVPNATGFQTYVTWDGSIPGNCTTGGSGGSGPAG